MQEGRFLKNKYQKNLEFKEAVKRATKAETRKEKTKPPSTLEEQIKVYLKRLYKGLTSKISEERQIDKSISERFKQFLIHKIKNRYFFNPRSLQEDKIQEIFKNIKLGNYAESKGYTFQQLRDSQIREVVIKLWEEETGNNFQDYKIPQEEIKKLTEQILKDQELSLLEWFDYLLSPEADNYPLEFRYWVFVEMLKCGSYDEERKTFNKRTKSTIALFPSLNQQALTIVLDEIIRKHKSEPSTLLPLLEEENKKEFEKILESENFKDLYGFALNYVRSLVIPKERLPIIKGEWRMFPKGSNPETLVETIKNFSTGWCIAGISIASSYLSEKDIFIYFSEDQEGYSTIPRAAIVYNPQLGKITEIRGIGPFQNLDPYIYPVVEKKLKSGEIPGSEDYLEIAEDQRKLAEIYLKYQNNQKITLKELRFIYEIDKEIKSFGYERDPRIDEILKSRDVRKDIANILNISEENIATNKEEINENTKVIFLRNKYERLSYEDVKICLSNLIYVIGILDLPSAPIESLGNLIKVGRSLYLTGSQIKDLGKLEEVGGSLYLDDTPIKSLGNLRRVGGDLFFSESHFSSSQIKDLGKLEEVGGSLYLNFTPIESLGNLRKVGRNLGLSKSQIKDLGKLEEVGGDLYLHFTPIESLGNLRKVGGNLGLLSSQIKDLGRLEEVSKEIYVYIDQQELISILQNRFAKDKVVILSRSTRANSGFEKRDF